jgi:hypothetical protein
VGRAAVPQDAVLAIVGTGKKQIKAFNLCDGKNNQTDIAKKTGLHQSNLSTTLSRWIKHGVVFSIGEGKDAKPLHIYPIPEASARGKTRRGH